MAPGTLDCGERILPNNAPSDDLPVLSLVSELSIQELPSWASHAVEKYKPFFPMNEKCILTLYVCSVYGHVLTCVQVHFVGIWAGMDNI